MFVNIFVDLDGVVANFDSHFTALTGMTYTTDHNLTTEQKDAKWKLLDPHPTFFRDLPLMDDARTLWEFLKPYNPKILSAATRRIPASEPQKREWVKEHFDIEGDEQVIIVHRKSDKAKYCKPGDVLIDDLPRNIEEWNAAGGRGILFVSAAHTIQDLQDYEKEWRNEIDPILKFMLKELDGVK